MKVEVIQLQGAGWAVLELEIVIARADLFAALTQQQEFRCAARYFRGPLLGPDSNVREFFRLYQTLIVEEWWRGGDSSSRSGCPYADFECGAFNNTNQSLESFSELAGNKMKNA